MISSVSSVVILMTAVLSVACARNEPRDRVRVSGEVEATSVRLSSETGGRITALAFSEGDRVHPGDIVARLDTRDVDLALQRAAAERQQAEAQLNLLLAGSRPEDIRQAEAQAASARADTGAAEADLRAAEADLRRFEALLQSNSGSQKQRDDAAARTEIARAHVQGARQRERAAQEAVARLRAGARPQEIQAGRARVAATDAQIAAFQKDLTDAVIRSTTGGIVTEKLAQAGEAIAPRVPLFVVTDLDHAWANAFVDEPDVPRIRLGQPATVFTDAGGKGLAGTITFISSKAEFTPRNVQTAAERSKLVYRVKVSVDNRDGVLKEGMPVEVELALQPVTPAESGGRRE